jgi:hypothetical protein
VIPAAPAKKAPVKKIPPKDVKQESSEFDSDEFLDDEVSNNGRFHAPIKKGPAKKSSSKAVKKKQLSPNHHVDSDGQDWWDYSNIEPWHNNNSLFWWIAGK